MKVLFDHPVPFQLAHGGLQVQIEQTQIALQRLGVECEPLRWWDAGQAGDVLHYFGRPPTPLVRLAQAKGMKVVLAELLTEQGSRSPRRLALQSLISRLLERFLPAGLLGAFHWQSYQLADACVALTRWEAQLMTKLFRAPAQKVQVIPNGVEEVFLASTPTPRGQWLVCSATITTRKRVLELAEAAVEAKTPLWLVGKPYAEFDPYAQSVFQLAQAHPNLIHYEGALSDRAALARCYRAARGFVLLSAMESLSLSALEAAACECPLLLSDLPWARTVFDTSASYCPVNASTGQTAHAIRQFYEAAPRLPVPPKPLSWADVARQLKSLYQSLLGRERV